MVITVRKALNQAKAERRQKRGGAGPNFTTLTDAAAAAGEGTLDQLIGSEPTPEFAAQVETCLERDVHPRKSSRDRVRHGISDRPWPQAVP
jgi:hypothetical protein